MKKYNQRTDFGSLFSGAVAMVSPVHEAITHRSLYDQVAPLELHPRASSLARQFFDQILRWHRRVGERRVLTKLDDHLLRDIGIERSQVLMESAKPFWRD